MYNIFYYQLTKYKCINLQVYYNITLTNSVSMEYITTKTWCSQVFTKISELYCNVYIYTHNYQAHHELMKNYVIPYFHNTTYDN